MRRRRSRGRCAMFGQARSQTMSVKMAAVDQAILTRRDAIVAALRAIVPGEGVIATEREMRPFESDGLTAYRQLPLVVVLPDTTEQVSRVLRYCHEQTIKVVPRGAGTSLSGGALPLEDGVLLGHVEVQPHPRDRLRQPGRGGGARRDQSGHQPGGRGRGLLLRARSVLADRLHHRRQHRGEFRRRALPEIRHDHQQRARLRTGADHRRDHPARRQASRCRRLRSARHRHRLGGPARRGDRGDRAHPEAAGNGARRAGRFSTFGRRRRVRQQGDRRRHHSRPAWR